MRNRWRGTRTQAIWLVFALSAVRATLSPGEEPAVKAVAPQAPAKPEAPLEYRGAALPLESGDIDSRIRRAEEHFQSEEWSRGIAVLDEVLADVTAPPGRKKPAAAVAKREKEKPPVAGGRRVRMFRRGLAVVPADETPTEEEADVAPGDAVSSSDGIRFVAVAAALRRRLLDLPPEARAIYRRTYEAPARQALEKALVLPPEKVRAELRRVGERYPLAPPGADAWKVLAERLLGAGRAAEAAGAFEVRLELPFESGDESTTRATTLAEAATAYALAGVAGGARRSLEEIARSHPETMVSVRGEAVAGRSLMDHPLFHELLERATPAEGKAPSWRTGLGTFDHAAFPLSPESMPPLGSQARWIHRLVPESEEKSNGRNRARLVPPFAPVRGASLGSSIFIRNDEDLVALDAHTGKVRWIASPGELGERRDPRQASFQPLNTEMPDDATSAVTVVEPRKAGAAAIVVCVHRALRVGETEAGKLVYEPNLLAAFYAGTGKLSWTYGQSDNERDPARGLAFTAAPVLASGLLVVPAARGESFYAVAVTPAGKTAWVRRLYTYNTAYASNYQGVVLPGLQLAAAEGTVVAANGHGIIVALDAATGEILWASRYRSQIRQGYVMQTPVPAPPVISSGMVLAAPPDSDYLTALDRRTGKILWEQRLLSTGRPLLLGASRELAFVGEDKVHAVRLADGKDAWTSEILSPSAQVRDASEPAYGYYAASAAGITSAAVAEGPTEPGAGAIVLAATRDGTLARIDARNGKILASIRLSDPHISTSEPVNLFLADGEILAVSKSRVFALEPQAASWSAAGDEAGKNLLTRARLLRAEGRFDEALTALGTLEKTLQSKSLVESVEKDIVVTARTAAGVSRRAKYVTELLARKEPLVKERRDVLSLRLLEAKLLEGGGENEATRAAYLALASLDGVFATDADGTEVDVGTYAADGLRELKAKGVPVSDPRGEERARDLASRQSASHGARAESFLVVRRPYLEGTAEREARLSAEAEADGDFPRALEIEELRRDDFPAPRNDVDSARLEKLAAGIPGEIPVAGLAELLDARRAAGAAKLAQLFWLPAEEGFIAAQASSSAPLPAIVSIFGTKLRFHDASGKQVLERPLPGYPDVSDIKLAMQANIEEPAVVKADGGDLVLFTAAGLYSFRGLNGASGAGGLKPRDFKLAWARTWTHPITDLASSRYSGSWGGIRVPEGKNFFPEVTFDAGPPIVLLRDGTLYSADPRTGKLAWRLASEHGEPASPPLLRGPWIVSRTASPAGLSLERRPVRQGGAASKAASSRFITGPDEGATAAVLAAGGLVAVFKGQMIESVEAETGRVLWRRLNGGAQVAFATGSEVWLSEPGGKLVARSLRSGRERRKVDVPEGAIVVEAFPEAASRGGTQRSWTLVLSRTYARASYWAYGDQTQTGHDLYLVRVGARGEKLWETQIHKGPVTYAGGRMLSKDGRYVLVFNADSGEEKWYTRAVVVDPANGSFDELFSVEIHGKGTGQPPRMQVLVDGLGVGNTDGFGWYAVRAAASAPPVEPGK